MKTNKIDFKHAGCLISRISADPIIADLDDNEIKEMIDYSEIKTINYKGYQIDITKEDIFCNNKGYIASIFDENYYYGCETFDTEKNAIDNAKYSIDNNLLIIK